MQIGIIGAGRMAKAMGGYLQDCGYTLCGLWSRSPEKAGIAAEYLRIPHCATLKSIVIKADILLLAVSDDGIREVSDAIAGCEVNICDKWAGHLSGSHSLDVMSSIERQGGRIFSLHPLQTLPEPDVGRKNLAKAVFVLEAEESLKTELEKCLIPCGNAIAWISPGKKALYHLGACLASNYVMVLYRLAEEALLSSGIPENLASQALIPLMEATLKSYETLGSLHGLTGPVSRGDTGTVLKHLESLQGSVLEQNEALIRALGLEALTMAMDKGTIEEHAASEMQRILKGGTL